jgi:hypothetical protein
MDLSDPIDRAALAFFLELERDPKRAKPFTDDTRRLARMLGLTSEWWTGNHVNDRRDKPVHPEGYVAHVDWLHCRAVRKVLLEAAERQAAK